MRNRTPRRDGRTRPESTWVHTSKDGRKYIVPSEVFKLKEFQKQLHSFKKLLKEESHLVHQ